MSNYEELIRPEFEVQCKKLGRGIERGVHSGEYASLPTYDAWEALKSATSPLLAALEEKDQRIKELEVTQMTGPLSIVLRRAAELERIIEGVDQLAIDGGWTARGLSEYAKSLEQRLQQPIKLPAGFRIVPIKATREQLSAVQVAGKSVVYTDMVLAAPEHPGFKVEGE